MCGIVAAAAKNNVVPVLVEGLKKLEYRGYDSAGIAVVEGNGSIKRLRSEGRVAELEMASTNAHAGTGIAHRRWATHGVSSETNAHPQMLCKKEAITQRVLQRKMDEYQALKAEIEAFKAETGLKQKKTHG